MKKYIHYGHTYFDPQLFTSVRNSFMAKPEGGFWASDINAKRGWAEWCADEGFRECNINNSFTFSLAVNAKILTINSVDDLEKLPKIKSDSWFAHSMWELLDYELLAKEYDAVEINISEDGRLYFALYGWDCDSIVVMNPDIVKV